MPLVTEEPYEGNLHVRFCGGYGRATGCFYPNGHDRKPDGSGVYSEDDPFDKLRAGDESDDEGLVARGGSPVTEALQHPHGRDAHASGRGSVAHLEGYRASGLAGDVGDDRLPGAGLRVVAQRDVEAELA